MKPIEYEELITEWTEPPQSKNTGKLPVSNEDYVKNVRDNCLLDLPNLGIEKENDKIMVMVCGGTTAKDYIDDIRQKRNDDRYRIFCSNKTHDWLISEGIIPHYMFVIDPKESKIKDVQNPHPDVEYLIGISCNPGVFKALEGHKVKRVFSVSGVGTPSDIQVIKALLPYQEITYVGGGSMAGLRAMTIADTMGFLTVEYYGFDSCYFNANEHGEPIYYSYEKRRQENIIEAQTDTGEIFLTSPVFASQARQFLKWKHRLEWVKFIIHGHSLTSEVHRLDDERCKPKHNLLITEEYKRLNKEMHRKQEEDEIYGYMGMKYAGTTAILIGQLIKKDGFATVLDYGCGKRTLEGALPPIMNIEFTNYDPCIEAFSEPPKPHDIVVCTDVLEHIEPECLENVLNDLERVTKKVALISIATKEASKHLSDGRNAHLIVEDAQWWIPKIKKRFHIIEANTDEVDNIILIVQSKKVKVDNGG